LKLFDKLRAAFGMPWRKLPLTDGEQYYVFPAPTERVQDIRDATAAAEAEEQAEETAAFLSGVSCSVCGRALTSAASVVRGMGPVCAAKSKKDTRTLPLTLEET
jgi:hypothetical protein